MSAPQIPNLLSLRGGRGRGQGRGLTSIDGTVAPSHEGERVSKDKIVRQTDQDASVSRLSAVEVGYLHDPFAKLFVSSEGRKRLPIINRGTYVRTKAIDILVDGFLSSDPLQMKQIISLGAGSDTRFFRIMNRERLASMARGSHSHPNLVYHEIDFPENTAQKLATVSRTNELCECIKPSVSLFSSKIPLDNAIDSLTSPTYYVHPVDLRTLDPSKEPPSSFSNIDCTLPTLIISECCLIYLDPNTADRVALYFTKHLFPAHMPLGLIVYEPIKPHDAFGKQMVSNLATRGIVLQTLRKYGSLEAQAARMRVYGFEDSRGADVNELWEKGVEESVKKRVAGLEMLDEVEEWALLAAHYCVVCGWREGLDVDKSEDEETSEDKKIWGDRKMWKSWERFPEEAKWVV